MSSMESAPASIPATNAVTSNPAFAEVPRQPQPPAGQLAQACGGGQHYRGDEPGGRHEIGVIEGR